MEIKEREYSEEEIKKINEFEEKLEEEYKEFIERFNAYISKNQNMIAGYNITTTYEVIKFGISWRGEDIRREALKG